MKTPLAQVVVLLVALAGQCLGADSTAHPGATGSIAGRVQNATNGNFLEKARVTVSGTPLETLTDPSGAYQLPRVPAGTVRVNVFFTGLQQSTSEVSVEAGKVTQHDVRLTGAGAPRVNEPALKLEEYVVTAAKEMDGAAIAINEQRFAANIMTVVAADEFGSMAEGNVGEFMKFLPGVTMHVGESGDANTISLNGVPANNVPVTIAGFDLASAAGGGTGREVHLDQVSLNSIARINLRNVGAVGTDIERAGPSTPAHARLRLREEWDSLWTFGLKAQL